MEEDLFKRKALSGKYQRESGFPSDISLRGIAGMFMKFILSNIYIIYNMFE